MEAWQVFILVFSLIVPIALMAAREPWLDDRLDFRGRPTERAWRRQITHAPVDDHH